MVIKKFYYVAIRLSSDEIFIDLDTLSKNKKEVKRKINEELIKNPDYCEKYPFVGIKRLQSLITFKKVIPKVRVRKTRKSKRTFFNSKRRQNVL